MQVPSHSCNSLCLHFNGHFPGEPGLTDFIGAKDNGGGGDNWSCGTCKSPVRSSPPTPNFLQVGCPSCCPTNHVEALKVSLVHVTNAPFQLERPHRCNNEYSNWRHIITDDRSAPVLKMGLNNVTVQFSQ